MVSTWMKMWMWIVDVDVDVDVDVLVDVAGLTKTTKITFLLPYHPPAVPVCVTNIVTMAGAT